MIKFSTVCGILAIGLMASTSAMANDASESPFKNYAQGFDDGVPIIHIPYGAGSPERSSVNIPGYSVDIIYKAHSDMMMYRVREGDKEVTFTTTTNGSRCRTLHGTSGETLFEACFV